MYKIVIDAMGGDHAPAAMVNGAEEAVHRWSDIEVILVGDEKVIASLLKGTSNRIHIHHATEVIATDEEPVKAVRSKKDSSMVVGARLVKEGVADALISAGNTGALMTSGLLVVGRQKGIDRPALSPILPTIGENGVLVLDVGANVDAKPQHLYQYAIMGSLYAEKVMGISKPRVGLINIGTEEKKGNELIKAAFPLLQEAPIHFIGNVEPRDIPFGVCDVAVCDGFTGNVLLKTMEGTAQVIFKSLKDLFMSSLKNKIAAGMLKSSLMQLKDRMDYKEYGGSPLLGLRGAVFKAHGSSDARAIVNAVDKARIFLNQNVIGILAEHLAEESDEE